MIPYIKVHSIDSSGMGYGDYTRTHTRGAKFNVTHSMLQGDQMTFQTLSKTAHDELETKRPIRFYTADDTKLFDGVITDLSYELIGNDYKKLTGTASGWWQELKSMDLVHQGVFSNMSPNDMFTELCRLANNWGMKKKAVYKYDTDKIPYYSLFNTAYETASGTDFVYTNIFQAMQDIASYLDVAETSSPYDFGLRIESLPAATGETWALSESDVDTGIYIIPFVMREEVDSIATYKTFKLEAGLDVRMDYRQIINNCIAVGETHHTQQLRTVNILDDVLIPSNDAQFVKDNQVLGNHYLQVIIDNITAFDKTGWIQITRVDGITNPDEVFPITVAAGECATKFTTDRTDDGLPGVGQFLRCVDLNGCHVQVREVTNDTTPYNTTIAGKSLNDIGYASTRIENMWISTQAQADALAGKMVRLYHNPMLSLDIPILNKYVNYTNVMGKSIDVYSQFIANESRVIAMDSNWEFVGELVTQSLTGMAHQTLWDDIAQFEYIIDLGLNSVVTTTGSKLVNL